MVSMITGALIGDCLNFLYCNKLITNALIKILEPQPGHIVNLKSLP